MRGADCGALRVDCGRSFTFHGASSSTAAESRRCTCQVKATPALWMAASTIKLPAVVFDGVKTSRMLSCQAVTIGRDVRGVASLAWGGVRGTGGDWSVIDHAAQPIPTPPLSPPRTCPSSMLNNTVWTVGFCPVSGTFCINRQSADNRPIVWHRLSASALSVHPHSVT